MSKPIIERRVEHVGEPQEREVEWTYEELLDLFSDEYNVVRPLVLRCQELEAELEVAKQNIPIDMACTRCEVVDCDVRGDAYNIGCEPRVDCLGAK